MGRKKEKKEKRCIARLPSSNFPTFSHFLCFMSYIFYMLDVQTVYIRTFKLFTGNAGFSKPWVYRRLEVYFLYLIYFRCGVEGH